MSSHVFTSDWHLGHGFVAGLRGFESVSEHDEAVLASMAGLREPDIVWILGDLVGQARHFGAALERVAVLPGRKRLVLGNHDPAHPMHRNAARWTPALAAVFEWWGTGAQLRPGVVLSHFPYTHDRGADGPRYPQWRLPDVGAILIHGHTHGRTRVWGREVHVGWDAWRRPVFDYELDFEALRMVESNLKGAEGAPGQEDQ